MRITQFITREGASRMIGERIRALRNERKLSISKLAQQASVAKSYLSAIERGIQGNPSIGVVERIAVVLGVPVNDLLSNE